MLRACDRTNDSSLSITGSGGPGQGLIRLAARRGRPMIGIGGLGWDRGAIWAVARWWQRPRRPGPRPWCLASSCRRRPCRRVISSASGACPASVDRLQAGGLASKGLELETGIGLRPSHPQHTTTTANDDNNNDNTQGSKNRANGTGSGRCTWRRRRPASCCPPAGSSSSCAWSACFREMPRGPRWSRRCRASLCAAPVISLDFATITLLEGNEDPVVVFQHRSKASKGHLRGPGDEEGGYSRLPAQCDGGSGCANLSTPSGAA